MRFRKGKWEKVMKNREYAWLLDEKFKGIQSEDFFEDLKRLEKGEPIDYVIGFSQFLGCHIDLSLRPLIPRTETEYWVEKAIEKIKSEFKLAPEIRCLDVFSGSGCIGISTLVHIPNVKLDFADIDERAMQQIGLNLGKNNIDPYRCGVFLSDIFQGIPVGMRYDVILANPPYIPYKNKEVMDLSVINYEPHNALFSQENGLEIIRKTLEQISGMLNVGGFLFLEFDDNQYEEILKILSELQGIEFNFYKDQFDKWRWLHVKNIV